jgi:hypothetical protein
MPAARRSRRFIGAQNYDVSSRDVSINALDVQIFRRYFAEHLHHLHNVARDEGVAAGSASYSGPRSRVARHLPRCLMRLVNYLFVLELLERRHDRVVTQ